MFVILGFRRLKPECVDDYLTNIKEMVRLSLAEPGCLRYDVLRDNDDPLMFGLYELFEDEAAARAHQNAPYHDEWRAKASAWYEEGPRIGRREATLVEID